MRISKQRQVLLYCSSIDTLDKYIELQKLCECNVVGICTDEYVFESSYKNIPIVQNDRIAEFKNAVMILLECNIPNSFLSAAHSANIAMVNFEDVEVVDEYEPYTSHDEQVEEAPTEPLKAEMTDLETESDNDTTAYSIESLEGEESTSQSEKDDDATAYSIESLETEETESDNEDVIDDPVEPIETEKVAPDTEPLDDLTESSAENVEADEAQTEIELEPEQTEETVEEPKAPVFSDEQLEDIKNLVSGWLRKVYTLLNNTKKNDTFIYNLNNELRKFKDGYYSQLTSSIVSDLILLREDCKNSVRDADKGSFKYNNYVNYLDCTIEQIKDKLDIYGVTISDGRFTYNGQVIYPVTDLPVFDSKALDTGAANVEYKPIVNTHSLTDITDLSTFGAVLDATGATIEQALLDRDLLSDSLEMQRMVIKKQVDVINGSVIIPLLRRIIRLELFFEEKMRELDGFKEQADAIYREAYEHGADRIENILFSLGVTVMSNVDDAYDPKHHKMIKTEKISPEEQEKNMHVAAFISDCYMRDDRVIAPAKVILYKL